MGVHSQQWLMPRALLLLGVLLQLVKLPAEASVNTRLLTYDSWAQKCSGPKQQWLRDYAKFHRENRNKPDAQFITYVSVSVAQQLH